MGILLLLLKGYEGSFLFLNGIRFNWADEIGPHLTHLGDGSLLIGLFGLILAPLRPQHIWTIFLTMIGILMIILIGKNYVFEDWDRPLKVFENKAEFFYISLDVLKVHAFPSGHSAAAAGGCTAFVLAFPFEKAWKTSLLAVAGIIVALTRVYIGVHFLGDVIAGTMIGTFMAIFVRLTFGNWIENRWTKVNGNALLIRQMVAIVFALLMLGLSFTLLMKRYYGL